jgi:lysyl-tRNA synthetase class 2
VTSLPKRYPDTQPIAEARVEAEEFEPGEGGGESRRLAGRVMARRNMGKVVFLDLVDRSGRIQLLLADDRTGPIDVNLGDIIGVVGRPARTRRGEPSLNVDEPPVLLAKVDVHVG